MTANEDDTPTTDDIAEPVEDKDSPDSSTTWSRNGWTWVAAGLLVAALGGGYFGYTQYRAATNDLAALRLAQSERDAAVKVATDYATKSLTYSFENPDAFFKSVEEGVSPVLKDKYVNAQQLLKAVIMQAQVTSSGEILSSEAVAQPGDVYQVTIAANQAVRNVQNPEPRVKSIVLQVTMNKVGDKWQVSDIGPRSGNRAAAMEAVGSPDMNAVAQIPTGKTAPKPPAMPALPAIPGR